MEKHPIFFTNLTKFFYRLDNSNFIVNKHDACKNCFWGDCISEFFDVDKSILLNRKIGYSESLLFELSTTVKYTFMLSLRSDDVIFLVFVKFSYSFYGKIIRLSSSTCKNNLLRICIYKFSNIFSRMLWILLTFPPKSMTPGMRIPKLICHVRKHCVQHS